MIIASCGVNYTDVAADTVYNMLEDSQGSKFNEAGVHLRTAAGIFERLHKVMRCKQSRADLARYEAAKKSTYKHDSRELTASAVVVRRGRFVWIDCCLRPEDPCAAAVLHYRYGATREHNPQFREPRVVVVFFKVCFSAAREPALLF